MCSRFSCIYTILAWAQRGYFHRFMHAADNLRSSQENILLQILKQNRNTQFGQKYQFQNIATYEQFAKNVPVSTYEDLQPYIQSIMQGQMQVLTHEKVKYLAISSGTSSASKYIPYTPALLHQFMQATGAWLYNLYHHRPQLKTGKAFWIVTPPAAFQHPHSLVPIGFDDDSAYFDFISKNLIKSIMAVPDILAKCTHYPDYLFLLAFFLLTEDNIVLISVWNPSVIFIIKNLILKEKDKLIESIKSGNISQHLVNEDEITKYLQKQIKPNPQRANQVQKILSSDNTPFKNLWPNLALISCWTESWAAPYLQSLQELFPGIEIQPKGLLATEGIVSIPITDANGYKNVLAANAHFYEFKCQETQKIQPAWELISGKKYELFLSTAGGFYRYPLNDLIEVQGFYKQLPILAFLGKTNICTDLHGEKLNAPFLENAMNTILSKHEIRLQEWMVAPSELKDSYILFICPLHESYNLLRQLQMELEEALLQNFHYAHARNLGQLHELRLFILESGQYEIFQEKICSKSKLSTQKWTHLQAHSGLENQLKGKFL